MKLLLQSDWQADNMTDPVGQAIHQLRWKGVDSTLTAMTLEQLLTYTKLLKYKDYTPIGTVEFVKAFAERVGVKLPNPIHANELLKLEGRKYATVRKKDLPLPRKTYPVFVKPLKELKKFTGFVARSEKDFELYPDVDWSNTSLFLTGVLENIVSEWRCYVLNGKVFACVNYSGDPTCFPRTVDIDKMLYNYTNAPIAYSLDIAVCIDKKYSDNCVYTSFIEINDAFSLGYYGGDVELYTKMLDLRWKQIVSQK